MSCIQVQNNGDMSTTIPRHSCIGTVNKFDEKGCYAVDPDTHRFAAIAWEPKGLKVTESKAVTKLANGISIYGVELPALAALKKVYEKFPTIWQDIRPVRVSDSEHMEIPLKDGWQDIKLSNKVYLLAKSNREYVDDTFDKLHWQGRMKWTNGSTSISSLVFVVWRNILEESFTKRKICTVVDIRKLNMMTVKDSYPLPLLDNMIASV